MEGLTRFHMENQRIQKRIATALERIADLLEGGKKVALTFHLDGKQLAETLVKGMPAAMRKMVKPSTKAAKAMADVGIVLDPPKPMTAVDRVELETPGLLKACKRRVRLGSVWHRKMGKAGVADVTVVAREATHAVLRSRTTGRRSRTRYDYFAVGIPGCKGQWQKGGSS